MGAYLIPPHNHSINDRRTFPDSPLLQVLQKIIEPLNEAVTVSSYDGFIIKANAAVEKVYGWPLQDVIGFHAKKFCASEGRENWENLAWNITEIITANDQWNGVVLEQNKTGETFPVLIKIVRVKAEGESYIMCYAQPFPEELPRELSPQEAQIFELLGQKKVIKEIGGYLVRKSTTFSPGTRRKFLKNVFNQTQARQEKTINGDNEKTIVGELKTWLCELHNVEQARKKLENSDRDDQQCLEFLVKAKDADEFLKTYKPVKSEITESTVVANILRIKEHIKNQTGQTGTLSTRQLEHLAVRCHYLGWRSDIKIENTEIIKAPNLKKTTNSKKR